MTCRLCNARACEPAILAIIEHTVIDDKMRERYLAGLKDHDISTCERFLALDTTSFKLNVRRAHWSVQAHIRSRDASLSEATSQAISAAHTVISEMFGGLRLDALRRKHGKHEKYVKKWRGAPADMNPSVNPYALHASGVSSFRIADNYAVARLDPRGYIVTKHRLLHIMHSITENDGHTCVTASVLFLTYQRRFSPHDPDAATFKDYIRRMLNENVLIKWSSHETSRFFLPEYFRAEQNIVNCLNTIDDECERQSVSRDAIKTIGPTLISEQVEAVAAVFAKPVTRVVITGSGGVGKSFTMSHIARVCVDNGLSVRLVAPTGVAAKRLKTLMASDESTSDLDASTVHRLLHCQTFGGDDDDDECVYHFAYDASNKLPGVDVLLIDENSMISVTLLASLLSAMAASVSLVFVGDPNQLPSIGGGAVLRDLVQCAAACPDVITHVHLATIHRQARDSNIIMACNDLMTQRTFPFARLSGDVTWHDVTNMDAARVQSLIVNVYKQLLSTSDSSYFVCTPMRKRTSTGLDASSLNAQLQEIALIEKVPVFDTYDSKLYVGDVVMCLKNLHEHDVYNGSVGTVIGKAVKDKRGPIFVPNLDGTLERYRISNGAMYNYGVAVRYADNKIVVHTAKQLQRGCLGLAYVATTHKTQGSEYDTMVVILHCATHLYMLDINLLYTAMSRAKKHLIIIADRKALEMSATKKAQERMTSLYAQFQQSHTAESLNPESSVT